MPPSILRRSKKLPFFDITNTISSSNNISHNSSINIVNKDDSGMSYQQLGFSPSAFLNTTENSSNFAASSVLKEMFTSTPAKGLTTTPKTPSILITPLVDEIKFDSSFTRSSSGVKKRKTIFDTSLTKKTKKKALVSTTPRTPTPLRSSKKNAGSSVCTETKLATIDEISKILMKKADTTSTPDHDYAVMTSAELDSVIVDTSLGELTTGGTSSSGNNKTSLRRTLFETPGQNASMVRPLGVNLFTEKELNAIEQMSTCFTPQKEKQKKQLAALCDANDTGQQQRRETERDTKNTCSEISTRLGGGGSIGAMGAISEKGGGFSFILNPHSHQQQQQQHKIPKITLFQHHQQQLQQISQLPQSASVIGLNQISGRPEIRILPLVGKPMKVPIRRLPPRNLNFSDNNANHHRAIGGRGGGVKMIKPTPTQGDAFRAVAFGQSHDQKFLTEQARLIMKEIHQASLI